MNSIVPVIFIAAAYPLFFSGHLAGAQLSTDRDELLNWCLKGINHKAKPGPEDQLFSMCSPWKDHSCCTHEITQELHATNMYKINYDHCAALTGGQLPKMSAGCKDHFIQDLCFYECEPNIGPWVKKTSRKIAEERFMDVPLCASDCDSWFNACREDYTCAYNWPRNLKFTKNDTTCPPGSKCKTFQQVFKTAKDFCENVWDGSWKVVGDEEPCMRIAFQGPNPNRKVAEYYVDHILKAKSQHDTHQPNLAISLFSSSSSPLLCFIAVFAQLMGLVVKI